jgi:hypothetical protein
MKKWKVATVNGCDYCRIHLQWQTFIMRIHIESWLNAYFHSIKFNMHLIVLYIKVVVFPAFFKCYWTFK